MSQVVISTLHWRALRTGFATLIVALALIAMPARAEQTDGAAAFVQDFGDQAIAVLVGGNLPSGRREVEFRRLFKADFDIDVISRFVLGKYRRNATPAERAEYTRLFEDFIIATYARRIGAYSDEQLVVGDVTYNGDTRAIVTSEIVRPDAKPIRVDWQLRRKDERWYFVDVVVEGMSRALTQRSEFTAFIRKNGGEIEGLLATMRQRTASVRPTGENIAAR